MVTETVLLSCLKRCAMADYRLYHRKFENVIAFFDVSLCISWRHPVELGNTF
jgi:hypothetical protein